MLILSEPDNSREREIVQAFAADRAQPLVLVIEQHEDTRQMLEYLLTTWGYCAVCAADGAQGLAIAARIQPELILTDVMLPLLDGLAVAYTIHSSATLSDVPIVFLSGHAEPAFRDRALAAGACKYLIKPLGLYELQTVLADCLTKKSAAPKQYFKGIY